MSDRAQQVRVNRTLSDIKYCSTGVPQGCVLSPYIFLLYTNDCKGNHVRIYIIKYADDTVILCLLDKDTEPSVFQEEVDRFTKWCDENHLILNVSKTQEMVLDPR